MGCGPILCELADQMSILCFGRWATRRICTLVVPTFSIWWRSADCSHNRLTAPCSPRPWCTCHARSDSKLFDPPARAATLRQWRIAIAWWAVKGASLWSRSGSWGPRSMYGSAVPLPPSVSFSSFWHIGVVQCLWVFSPGSSLRTRTMFFSVPQGNRCACNE
jgi:hypothetical protein